jgi:hypothetical protein
LVYVVLLPEALEVDQVLPRKMGGRFRNASSDMARPVTSVVIVLVAAPLEIALWVRRRGLARGRTAWHGVLTVAVSTAVGVAVAWWPARRWMTDRAVASAVRTRRPPVPPEDLPVYEAWVGEIAEAYISTALIASAVVWVVVRLLIALVVWRRRRSAAGR